MMEQIKTIMAFFIDGILIGGLFDLFRATRKSYKISNFLTYIEDVLFWLLAGVLTLYVIDVFTNGQIRLYMILLLIFGYIFYIITISKLILKINTRILNTIKYIFEIFLKPFINIKKIIKNIKK